MDSNWHIYAPFVLRGGNMEMKNLFCLLFALLCMLTAGCTFERIYVGSSDGISRMVLMLEPRFWYGAKVSNTPGISYMARQGKFLYAARRVSKGGYGVDSYQILKNGDLKALNSFTIPGKTGYCHISLSADGKFLFGSSYSGAFVDLLSLNSDGRIIKLHKRYFFSGRSVHKRQKKSHPHFASQTPDGKMILVADLGSDRIHTFKYDAVEGALPEKSIAVTPGAGPRHLSFSEDGKFFFAANELNNTVTSFTLGQGKIKMIDSCSLLPDSWKGTSYAGAIKTIPGNRLCVTNRGHDSIAVVKFDPQGKLKLEKIFSAAGNFPYDLEYINGKLFLVNMRSDTFSDWTEKNNDWKINDKGTIRRPMCVVAAEKR